MGIQAILAWAVLALASSAMAGCATAPPPPVQVVADTFCQTAKKRTWSVDDTPATIQEAVTHNAGIDRACGYPGQVATASKAGAS